MVSPSSIRSQDEGTKESTGYPLRQSDFGYWLAFKLLRINHMNLGHNCFFIMHPRDNPTTVHCGTIFLKDRNTPIAEAVLSEIMVLDLHQVIVIEFLPISRYNAHNIVRSRSIYSHCDQLPQFRRSLWVTSERSIPIPIEVPIAMSFQRGDARNSPQSQLFSPSRGVPCARRLPKQQNTFFYSAPQVPQPETIAEALWLIWKQRNAVVFRARQPDPQGVMADLHVGDRQTQDG